MSDAVPERIGKYPVTGAWAGARPAACTLAEDLQMNEPYEDVVTIFPSEKSLDGKAVLFKFQTRSGELLRLRLSSTIARGLGTQLLLLSATSAGR